jgi:hypothetical protein
MLVISAENLLAVATMLAVAVLTLGLLAPLGRRT